MSYQPAAQVNGLTPALARHYSRGWGFSFLECSTWNIPERKPDPTICSTWKHPANEHGRSLGGTRNCSTWNTHRCGRQPPATLSRARPSTTNRGMGWAGQECSTWNNGHICSQPADLNCLECSTWNILPFDGKTGAQACPTNCPTWNISIPRIAPIDGVVLSHVEHSC